MDAVNNESVCWAQRVRYALMTGIIVMMGLLAIDMVSPRSVTVKSAYGELGAAPGFLLLTLGSASGGGGAITGDTKGGGSTGGQSGANRFFIVDTAKQVICAYHLSGDKIRLASARDFSHDTDIQDASLDVPGPNNQIIKSFEGGSGIDRITAEAYAEGLKKLMEAGEKTK